MERLGVLKTCLWRFGSAREQFRSPTERVLRPLRVLRGAAMEKDKAGTALCCTPTVIPGAAPPRPKLGRGRRITVFHICLKENDDSKSIYMGAYKDVQSWGHDIFIYCLALFVVIEAWAKRGCTTKLCQESASCHGGCILSKHDLPSADDVADHHWCVHVFVWHLPPISPTTLELERSFAQRVGKTERQYTLLITTDFVYIVSITFERPNRFRWAHRIPSHEALRDSNPQMSNLQLLRCQTSCWVGIQCIV